MKVPLKRPLLMLNFSPMFTANEMRLSNKVYKVQFKPREESIKVKVNASSWIRLFPFIFLEKILDSMGSV